MAAHQDVISPDGDRPDCYRNYEAIGLGTVPIVMGQPDLWGWMPDAVMGIPVNLWNDEAALKELLPPYTGTHRNFVLLEYWREKVNALHRSIM